ncbi:hypothetical protein OPV22_032346 [Ensete ventricosum]|uniref:WAT1-related protein n=1 Tax=Ensete ventricosum TaxID=4639 RepID=A0AAV8PX40_ENSVE|nr:hypothetical protein OPV22_032346 [Ensete ventricosum]
MVCNWSEWRSVFAMLAVDVMLAVMNTMVKKVMEEGMNRLILITLRQLIATLFMAPIAYFHERKTRPKLTVEIFVYIFFSALIGVSLMQFLFFFGLHYTSATFAYAFLNVSPVFTFLISLALRMESLNPKTKAGIAKAIGATVCFIGVIVLMFYKGVALNQAPHRSMASAQPQSPPPLAMSYTSNRRHELGHGEGPLRLAFEEEAGDRYCDLFGFCGIWTGVPGHVLVYLGSVLGSVLVIAGLYSLLWGKNKEARSCAAKAAEGNGENQLQV